MRSFILILISISSLAIWGGINAFIPALIIKELNLQNNIHGTEIAALLIIMILSPFLYLIGEVTSQTYIETKFINQRLNFFKKYTGKQIPEQNLFSQNASIIKDASRIIKIDTPIFVIMNFILLLSLKNNDAHYLSGIYIAYAIGIISLVLPYYLSRRRYLQLSFADNIPTELYKIYTSSFPTFKYGLMNLNFKDSFLKSSYYTRSKIIASVKDSIIPSTLINSGMLLAFGISAYFLYSNNKSLIDLIPLYFQISLITTIFLQISSKIPTLIGFYGAQKAYGLSTDLEKSIIKNLIKKSNGIKIDFLNEFISSHKFGNHYQLVGSNGCGKSTFLRELFRKACEKELEVIYISQNTNIAQFENLDIVMSDGERQFNNIIKSIELNPNILILDECLNCIDKEKIVTVSLACKEFLKNENLIISVNHASIIENFDSIKIYYENFKN